MLVVVADRWDPGLGGRERYADDFVTYLSAEGRQVTKAVTGSISANTTTRLLALTPTRNATHYQLHSGLLAGAFAAERESFQSSVRRALFQPALFFNRRRQRLLDEEARLLAGPAALMVFSHAGVRSLVEARGVPGDRVWLSRPGVDLRRFTPPLDNEANPSGARSLRLAFVGHNFLLKGLHAAIGALARARRAGVPASLVVAGGGATRRFQRLAATVGVAEHVRFVGRLSQDQVAELYRHSDAILHPTFYDPFPRVIIEALACGCPVITTQRCGAAEIMTPGREGLVVRDPRDVAALAEAIGTLDDRATLRRMRTSAAALGRQFDQETHFREASAWLFDARGAA